MLRRRPLSALARSFILIAAYIFIAHPAVMSAEEAGILRLFEGLPVSKQALRNDLRPAVLLSAPLEQTVTVPPNARIFFGHGSKQRHMIELVVSVPQGGERPLIASFFAPANSWRDEAVDLKSFSGMTVRIAFRTRFGRDVLLNSPFLATGSNKPNVILIGIDTLRADHLGCYGYDLPTSPTLDALSKEGVLFENAYSQTAWTLASFVSIFTGLYPAVHDVVRPDQGLNENHETLTSLLRRHGYYTTAIHEGGYLRNSYGFHHGFDAYRRVQGLRDFSNRRQSTLKWISSHREVPFFLFIQTYDLHAPYGRSPQKYHGLFTDPSFEDRFDHKRIKPYENKNLKDFAADDARHLSGLYDGCVRFMDEEVGRLFHTLKEAGLLENTYIIFVSDHGEEFLDHGGYEHHRTLHEEVTHVPLLIWGPGISRGKRVPDLVETVDILPTVTELLGLTTSEESRSNGESLTGFLFGENAERLKHYTVAQLERNFDKNKLLTSIRTAELSYIHDPAAPQPDQLFDRITDRREKQNLAAAHPEEVLRMTQMYRQILDESLKAKPSVKASDLAPDEDRLRELRSLGYLN